MPHAIILMNEKLDEMDGGSSTGTINQLRIAVNATEQFIETSASEPTAAHEKMEEIQTWLVDDSTAGCGAADQIATFVSDLQPYQ